MDHFTIQQLIDTKRKFRNNETVYPSQLFNEELYFSHGEQRRPYNPAPQYADLPLVQRSAARKIVRFFDKLSPYQQRDFLDGMLEDQINRAYNKAWRNREVDRLLHMDWKTENKDILPLHLVDDMLRQAHITEGNPVLPDVPDLNSKILAENNQRTNNEIRWKLQLHMDALNNPEYRNDYEREWKWKKEEKKYQGIQNYDAIALNNIPYRYRVEPQNDSLEAHIIAATESRRRFNEGISNEYKNDKRIKRF